MRRGRSDPSAVILEQLISPLHDLGGSRPRPPHGPNASTTGDKDTDGPLASVADSALDMRVSFHVTYQGNDPHVSLPLDQEHFIYMEAFAFKINWLVKVSMTCFAFPIESVCQSVCVGPAEYWRGAAD